MGMFDKLFGSKKPSRPEAVAATTEKGAVCSPAAGRVEVTDQIPDPVFAGEAMGKTVAVWPETGDVFAPISGTVASAMPTRLIRASHLVECPFDRAILKQALLVKGALHGPKPRAVQGTRCAPPSTAACESYSQIPADA